MPYSVCEVYAYRKVHKLCLSIFNEFFVTQRWFNGFREVSRTFFFNGNIFHHNIMQGFPVDFLLFLKPKLKLQKCRKYVLLLLLNRILLSVFTYTFHSCLNKKQHGLKVKYKRVCLEEHLIYEVIVTKCFWINKLVTFKCFRMMFLLM